MYSSSVLVGYDHTVTGDSRIAVTLQPTELSEPNCAGTAPAIALSDIVVSAIDATSATVTVPVSNADNTVVYFRYFSYAANIQGWQSRQVQVSSTPAQVTLTGLDPGTRYCVQASLDQGFDRGRNRVTTIDTLPRELVLSARAALGDRFEWCGWAQGVWDTFAEAAATKDAVVAAVRTENHAAAMLFWGCAVLSELPAPAGGVDSGRRCR